jgi:hypothetical protein
MFTKTSNRPTLREERRRELRHECTPVIVHAHLANCEERVMARVKEMSDGGLQLHTDVPWPVSTRVTIDLTDQTVHGEVRYCESQPDLSWSVGIRLRDAN